MSREGTLTIAADDVLATSGSSPHSTDSRVTSFSTTSSGPSNHNHPWMSVKRPRTAPGPRTSPFLAMRSHLVDDDTRRDSALTSANLTSTSAAGADPPTRRTAELDANTFHRVPSLPSIIISEVQNAWPTKPPNASGAEQIPRSLLSIQDNENASDHIDEPREKQVTHGIFHGITTDIPTGSLDDLFLPGEMEFSNRGSVLLGGGRTNGGLNSVPSFRSLPQTDGPPSRLSSQLRLHQTRSTIPNVRVLSADEEMLSIRVRSMYEHGNQSAGELATTNSVMEVPLVEEDEDADSVHPERSIPSLSTSPDVRLRVAKVDRTPSIGRGWESWIQKEPNETAGGIEDWQDVGGGQVDRYGFILPKKTSPRGSSAQSTIENLQLRRVTTSLQLASEGPRRRRTVRRVSSNSKSAPSTATTGLVPKNMISIRSAAPTMSVYSNRSSSTNAMATMISPFRYASNLLPHNRERRLMDEASDMLTLPPGLADIAEQKDDGKAALAMKRKECQREEKWRKMGKVTKTSAKGGGMLFDFDTRDAKLINRTWKGIPDRWRATAWWAFLEASAKRRGRGNAGGETAEKLIEAFYETQERSCVDDVQIDVDVPRTINSHIMFRRRYRGGQRLLFRVLHALSLYLPDTGYVQGMAALAATLLCYYDEENAFVMMARLWQLRGLDNLYRPGFGGLMEALDEFETHWLNGDDVAVKLREFGITSTTYGTRWYLTLFNYSIPFPAQLRVWDVFMLLGDGPDPTALAKSPAAASSPDSCTNTPPADLDVLHATAAALIDAEREILRDSDFENAMKVLTSWIPVRDEEILMRVARAEYRKVRKKLGKGV